MADKPTILSLDDISILDKQVEVLSDFKPIPEHEVKMLCDKVRKLMFIASEKPMIYFRQKKF